MKFLLRFCWVVLVAAIVGIVSVEIFFVYAGKRARHEFETYRDELLRNGERLDLKKVLRSFPPTASIHTSSVQTSLKGIPELLPDVGPTINSGQMRHIVWWREEDISTQFNGITWSRLGAILRSNESLYAQLETDLQTAAALLGELRSPVDEFLDTRSLMERLSKRAGLCELVELRALACLHEGRTEAALGCITFLLKLAPQRKGGRSWSDGDGWDRFAGMAAQLTWQLLQSDSLDDPMLSELGRSWAELDLRSILVRELERERAVVLSAWERVVHERQSPWIDAWYGKGDGNDRSRSRIPTSLDELKLLGEDIKSAAARSWARLLWKQYHCYDDALLFLKASQLELEMLRNRSESVGLTLQIQTLQADTKKLFATAESENYPFVCNGPPGAHAIQFRLLPETQRTFVITAIAVKRYQLRYGKLPAGLTELMPEFLGKLPLDPFNGAPAAYQTLSSNQYTLSVSAPFFRIARYWPAPMRGDELTALRAQRTNTVLQMSPEMMRRYGLTIRTNK